MEDCRITGVDVRDVRFPTSRTLAGSDAMNEAPDYSAAYVILETDCFWRELTGESHLRWIGPEKGVIHLATAALVNAVWDLWARADGKPVWQLLVDMPPEQLVG